MFEELLIVAVLAAVAVFCNAHAARVTDPDDPRRAEREAEWARMIAHAFDRRD